MPSARPPVTVDLTSNRLVRKAKLKDDLFSTVEFFNLGDGSGGGGGGGGGAGDYDVGYIDAFVREVQDGDTAAAAGGSGELALVEGGGTVILDQAPQSKRHRGHPVTMVGDFDLQAFARKLLEGDMDVSFQNGVLVCGEDQVLLRRTKTDNGCKIEIVGALCPAYDQLRTMLYQEFDFF
eukprot:SAG22_NODE_86_length_21440_cov_288.248700_18_plen_179_part_00